MGIVIDIRRRLNFELHPVEELTKTALCRQASGVWRMILIYNVCPCRP